MECIEIIYCQYYPAIWDVISNTLPLWKKESRWSDSGPIKNIVKGDSRTKYCSTFCTAQYRYLYRWRVDIFVKAGSSMKNPVKEDHRCCMVSHQLHHVSLVVCTVQGHIQYFKGWMKSVPQCIFYFSFRFRFFNSIVLEINFIVDFLSSKSKFSVVVDDSFESSVFKSARALPACYVMI